MNESKRGKSLSLVFPRFKYPSGDFSLGLAYLAGYIKEKIKDIEVNLLDMTFNPDLGYARAYFKKNQPDIVGVYTDTLMFKDSLRIAEIAKDVNANVIFGGPHPSIMPETVIGKDCVDALCVGEGELVLEDYIKAFFSNKVFDNIEGLWFKRGREIIRNPGRRPLEDLDIISYPDCGLFDVERYISLFFQMDSYNPNLRGISMMASRGCRFNCSYCQPALRTIFGSKARIVSPGKVINELKFLKERYKINAFYFQDDNLTAFRTWVEEFCGLLRKEGLALAWACDSRADTADFDILKMMRDSGLVKIKVGIESINDRIRNKIYKKNVSRQQIKDFIEHAGRLKVQVAGFFMLGGPTETKEEVWETISFAANSDLIEANFNIATPLPGTELLDRVERGGYQSLGDYSRYDYYNVRRPKMSKEEIGIGELKLYKKIAYLYFYLHPKRIHLSLKSGGGRRGLRKTLLKLQRF